MPSKTNELSFTLNSLPIKGENSAEIYLEMHFLPRSKHSLSLGYNST
jgi:hypothetical protein